MAADFVFKIIIVGEPGVGKSCLLRRFADQSYTENYINTIGVDFKVRTLEYFGKTVKLNIWDSAGQERFRTIVNTYYRGAHGICVVYDITDLDSFNKVNEWLRDASEMAESTARKLVVGTKLDMEQKRKVPLATVQAFCEHSNVPYIETSSKNGQNVEAAFNQLTRMLLQDFSSQTLQGDVGVVVLGENTSEVGRSEVVNKKKCC